MNLRFKEESGPSGFVVISTTGYFEDLNESLAQGVSRLIDYMGGLPKLHTEEHGIATFGWWKQLGTKKKLPGLVLISFVFGQILFVVVSPTRTLARNYLVRLFRDVGLTSIEEYQAKEKAAGLSFPASEAISVRELEKARETTRRLIAENINP